MKSKEISVIGKKEINVMGQIIGINKNEYISLTDIAKRKEKNRPEIIIQNWMRNKNTIEFLGLWENINNKNFNHIEFDAVKMEAGTNSFILPPSRWIKRINSIGIEVKMGKYGGTFAHQDIAMEFASWISVEFKLYFIKEFQRLKEKESLSFEQIEWNVKRALTKVNYQIHTDAIKENLIPKVISELQIKYIYSSEADVLNIALFGMTAKDWRSENPTIEGNIRDYCNVSQLVCLSNLESINSIFINDKMTSSERIVKLNEIAISQMKILVKSSDVKRLK